MDVKARIEELLECAKDDENVINQESLSDLLDLMENPPLDIPVGYRQFQGTVEV